MRAQQKMDNIKGPVGEGPVGDYFMEEDLQGLSDIEVPQSDASVETFDMDDMQGFWSEDDENEIPDISDDEIPDIDTPASERVSINSNQ